MKKILLIVSFLRYNPESVEKALALTRERDAELIVFFVLDVEFAEKIVHKLTDEGWIGGKPSEQLYISLLREYKFQAESKIGEIERQAKQVGVPLRSLIKSGAILEETMKIVQVEDPDLIIMSRRKRSNLSRLIFGSLSSALSKHVKCEVQIIDS